MACIYNTQGKCVGMISPNHFHILYRAFYRAKLDGMHDKIKPAPASFASELQGLLSRKTLLENKYSSKKIKDSFSRALPADVHSALQKWALVTQEKMASPLDYDPHYQHYWSCHTESVL